jgi:hypothetical protein
VPSYFFLVIYENNATSSSLKLAGILRFVRFAPLPTKLVAVTTPEAFTPVTVILGVPERPKEVVAKDTDEIPVRFAPEPTKLVAVTTPEAFTPVTVILGVPERPKEVVAKEAVLAVPVMVPVKLPTKLEAVTTPVTLILVAPILTAFIIPEEDKSRLSPEASSCI